MRQYFLETLCLWVSRSHASRSIAESRDRAAITYIGLAYDGMILSAWGGVILSAWGGVILNSWSSVRLSQTVMICGHGPYTRPATTLFYSSLEFSSLSEQ